MGCAWPLRHIFFLRQILKCWMDNKVAKLDITAFAIPKRQAWYFNFFLPNCPFNFNKFFTQKDFRLGLFEFDSNEKGHWISTTLYVYLWKHWKASETSVNDHSGIKLFSLVLLYWKFISGRLLTLSRGLCKIVFARRKKKLLTHKIDVPGGMLRGRPRKCQYFCEIFVCFSPLRQASLTFIRSFFTTNYSCEWSDTENSWKYERIEFSSEVIIRPSASMLGQLNHPNFVFSGSMEVKKHSGFYKQRKNFTTPCVHEIILWRSVDYTEHSLSELSEVMRVYLLCLRNFPSKSEEIKSRLTSIAAMFRRRKFSEGIFYSRLLIASKIKLELQLKQS